MTTVNTAVQNLINKINTGSALTPEEIMYLAQAVNALSENTTLEQALIAVAEGHLTTAVGEINTSRTALQTAQANLQTTGQNAVNAIESARNTLVSQAGSLASLPNVVNQVTRQYNRWTLSNIPHRTMFGVSNNMKFTCNSGENLPFRYVDHITGKTYAAYTSLNAASSVTGPVFHFGYWQRDGSTFTTLLRRTDPVLNNAYRWSGINHVPNVLILPLAKSDNANDIRICFIPLSSFANCIIHVHPTTDVVTHLPLSTNCNLGNTARPNPLATTQTANLAYDKINRRLVAGNGDFVFWDGVFGVNVGSATDGYPQAEINKLNQYIEFSGRHQKFVGGNTRFRRWLFDMYSGVSSPDNQPPGSNSTVAMNRDVLNENIYFSNGVNGGQFISGTTIHEGNPNWLPNDGFMSVSATPAGRPPVLTSHSGQERTVWSQLVRKADGSVDFEQLWTRPNFLTNFLFQGSTLNWFFWSLDSVDVEVTDSNGGVISTFNLKVPTRNKVTGFGTVEVCNYFLPVSFDSVNKVAHCVYGLNSAAWINTNYTSLSSHGLSSLDAIYKENGYV